MIKVSVKISANIIDDQRVNARAKFLYVLICGNEKKKRVPQSMFLHCLRCSEDSFRKSVDELVKANYIAVQECRNKKGQFIGNKYLPL